MGKRMSELPLRDRVKYINDSQPKVENKDDGSAYIKPGAVPNAIHQPAMDSKIASTSEEINAPLTDEDKECLRSLAFPEMETRYYDISDAIAGSNRWLLKRSDYQRWAQRGDEPPKHSVYWIKGNPGTGKSTLMRQLVKGFEASQGLVMVSFFFSARGVLLQRSSQGLFRSLIHTLFQLQPRIRHIVLEKYRKRREIMSSDSDWHDRELEEVFRSIFTSPKWNPTTIFIDALDECDIDDLESLVEMFIELSDQQPDFRLCVSSRHYHNIRIPSYYEVWVELENGADIALYVDKMLPLRYEKGETTEKLTRLKDDIIQKACGVFLWVELVIKQLKRGRGGKNTLKQMREILSSVPPGLTAIYSQLTKTDNKNDSKRMWQVIALVLFAEMPMRLRDFRYALGFSTDEIYPSQEAFEQSDDNLNDNEDLETYIRHTSRGLIEVVSRDEDFDENFEDFEETKVRSLRSDYLYIQVIHESVRDYFLTEGGLTNFAYTFRNIDSRHGHELFVQTCLHYLNIMEVQDIYSNAWLRVDPDEDDPTTSWGILKATSREGVFWGLPFLTYCARYLFHHIARQDSNKQYHEQFVDNLLAEKPEKLLGDKRAIQPASLFVKWKFFHHCEAGEELHLDLPDGRRSYGPRPSFFTNLIHTAAAYGILGIVKICLEKKPSLSTGGKFSGALEAAAAFGQTETVALLLKSGVNINACRAYSALHWAVGRNCTDTVELLLNSGADINVLDCEDRTPFEIGLRRPEISVQLLRSLYIPKDAEDTSENIIIAATRGSTKTLQFLLDQNPEFQITLPVFEAVITSVSEDCIEKCLPLLDREKLLEISKEVVLEALWFGSPEAVQFLLNLDNDIIITEADIIKSWKSDSDIPFLVLRYLEDQLPVTPDLLIEAAPYPEHFRALLGRSDAAQITEEVLIASAHSYECLQHALEKSKTFTVSENVVVAAASHYDMHFELYEWPLMYLLYRDDSILISESVLVAAAASANLLPLEYLLNRDCSLRITENVLVAAASNWDSSLEWLLDRDPTLCITRNILKGAASHGNIQCIRSLLKLADHGEVTQDIFETLVENLDSDSGTYNIKTYAEELLKELLRDHNNLEVSEKVLKAASRNEFADDILEVLFEHIGSLQVELSDEFLERLAADGHVNSLDRLKYAGHPSHNMETWIHLAELVSTIFTAKIVGALLAQYDLPLNIRNSDGKTLIWKVCEYGHREIVSLLLKTGADPTIPDNQGWTPLRIAKDRRHYAVIYLLQELKGITD